MKQNKERKNVSLSPECLEVLDGFVGGSSTSRMIEVLTARFAAEDLKDDVYDVLINSCRKPIDTLRLYLAIQKAQTEEGQKQGFQVFEHPEKGIIAVVGPHPVSGERVPYPPVIED